MTYGYTIARYAHEKGMTLTDAFKEAADFYFVSSLVPRDLWNDVKKYKEVGAVPIYVSEFIRDKQEKAARHERLMANPLFRILRSVGLPQRTYT